MFLKFSLALQALFSWRLWDFSARFCPEKGLVKEPRCVEFLPKLML